MKTIQREIRLQRQRVRDESERFRSRLRATDRLARQRAASPKWLALGFGGGLLIGMLHPLRVLVAGRLWAVLIGAIIEGIQGIRAAFFQTPGDAS